MAYLRGLQEYLDETYNQSIFDVLVSSKELLQIHLHEHRIIRATVTQNLRYDIKANIEGGHEEVVPKVNIKMIYSGDLSETVNQLIKTDKNVRDLGLEPILAPGKRYHVKNKSLFPLMKERNVVFFTLLEGEIIKGIIADFNRYEITANLKGGIPVTILRHSIYDLRDKKGRCFLKSHQDKYRDWEKSELYVLSTSTQ